MHRTPQLVEQVDLGVNCYNPQDDGSKPGPEVLRDKVVVLNYHQAKVGRVGFSLMGTSLLLAAH